MEETSGEVSLVPVLCYDHANCLKNYIFHLHNRPICFIINRLYRYTIVNMLSKIYKYYKEVDGLIQYKFIHVLYKIFSNYHKNLQINNKRKHNIREILNNKS